MNIKAVCFDLDGVYFTPESFRKFKNTIGKGIDTEILGYVFHESPEMLNFKRGKISENEYWNFVRKELDINLTNEQIFEILRNSYEVNQEIADIVKQVRAKGFKTCICSNNFETRIRELNNKFDFLNDFDVHVFSYKVGTLKPNKEIFKALIKDSNVEANQIIYSDDSPNKLSGAIELGINTFVFDTVDRFIAKLKEYNVL